MAVLRPAAMVLCAALSAAAGPTWASTTLPPWIQGHLSAPLPEHEAKTPAVILYNEITLNVLASGKIQRTRRQVTKILRPEGLDAGLLISYSNGESRTMQMHGWNIPPGAPPADVDDRDAVDSSVIGVPEGNLVDDVRTRLLRIPAVVPGNIVAGEIIEEIQPYMLADDWVLQSSVPVRETHYVLNLPTGWSYKAHWINHAEVAGTTTGGTHTEWTLTDLKAIREEQQMPPWLAVSGRLALSFVAPGARTRGFETWSDIGAWFLNLAQSRQATTPAIKQQVTTLTAGQTMPLGKIRALAAFVQGDIRYVAIELGIGGFQPHAAADVFTHRYGDCKDKATLLIALLREIGVDADYVIVNTERGAISDATPPNLGFNHVIVAIHLPAGVEDAGLLPVMAHPRLGRILFFDPTDRYTPPGGLSGALQDGFGLLVNAAGSEMVHLPVLPPAASALRRSAHFKLDEAGLLSGPVDEISTGDAASFARATLDATSVNTDKIKPIEALMARAFSTFNLSNATVRNRTTYEQPFEWHYTVDVPGFAETSGDVITLRPRVLGSKTIGLLETKEDRENDIEFESPRLDTDLFEIALPPGYTVEDLPMPINIDYPYAAYHSKTELAGHTLKYTRTFEIRKVTVPAAQAPELKEFFRVILNDEDAVAVLHRADK